MRLAWLGLLVSIAAPLAQGSEARDWLERMNRALAERNYDATFIHARGNRAETLRIMHRVRNDEICERLMSLDGSGREFIRQGDQIRYFLPAQRKVLLERRPRAGGLLPTFPRLDAASTEWYALGEVREVRWRERDARLVALQPRDPYRYGYRVWIDARTHMPLKSELFDEGGQVLEQITFTNLAVFDDLPDEMFQPPPSSKNFREVTYVAAEPSLKRAENAALVWNVRILPRGFRLTQRGEQLLPGADSPVSHLVFSDGLASVSVFIGRRLPPRTSKEIALERQIGAATTVSTEVEGYEVVVVGEVPMRTARFIAAQLKAEGVRTAEAR
jgi:sigma-E factor negative regulatory protein RseB